MKLSFSDSLPDTVHLITHLKCQFTISIEMLDDWFHCRYQGAPKAREKKLAHKPIVRGNENL